MALKLVPRAEWGARRPILTRPTKPLELPAPIVFCCYTRTTLHLDSMMCAIECRNIQRQDQAWHSDVRYNFLVGGDGRVYEGRGWSVAPLLSPQFIAEERHAIFIGCMAHPTSENKFAMLEALQELILVGIENNYIVDDHDARFI